MASAEACAMYDMCILSVMQTVHCCRLQRTCSLAPNDTGNALSCSMIPGGDAARGEAHGCWLCCMCQWVLCMACTAPLLCQ